MPENPPVIDAGSIWRAMRLTSSVASPSEMPAAKLNEIVTDAICPEWATLNGPVVASKYATSLSGT